MNKKRILLNHPAYVGMSILELSKQLMDDFYYNQLKKEYGDLCELLYTDTDSLLLEIHTRDVYAEMVSQADLYDTSNYPKDQPLRDVKNKKVLGKRIDECAGVFIVEYVGLRPKMYSIEAETTLIKKAKGVKKCVVKKQLRNEQYKEALSGKTFHHSMNLLRSVGYHIYGVHQNKMSLSPLDTKRYICDDGIHTLAYGHSDIV